MIFLPGGDRRICQKRSPSPPLFFVTMTTTTVWMEFQLVSVSHRSYTAIERERHRTERGHLIREMVSQQKDVSLRYGMGIAPCLSSESKGKTSVVSDVTFVRRYE